jgi:hypothetical protein
MHEEDVCLLPRKSFQHVQNTFSSAEHLLFVGISDGEERGVFCLLPHQNV